ncbi:MAG: hypothetical protein Q8K60_01615 [Parachlamydiaceae bacterium]|nr:hypothetical protein [Parachlamydiaceae bacterium]
MNRSNRWGLIIFLFSSFLLTADENLNKISKHAQVYSETNEYSKAIKLYSELLNESLQPWQVARLHYNLGLLKLAQNQSKQALDEFLQINPLELSFPENVKKLFFYEAIAYIQQAEDLKKLNQPITEYKQSYLLQKSLILLENAKKTPCLLHSQENENLKCEPSLLINTEKFIKQRLKDLEIQSQEIKQEKTPKEQSSFALKQLIIAQNQAILSLKMTYQIDLLIESTEKQKNKLPLQQQQKQTLEAGNAFIPAVLKDQEKEFIQKNPTSCLISKWNDVISLFDEGYQSAKNGLVMLSNESFSIEEIMIANELTVQYWQQAIELLLSPPQPSSSDAINQTPKSTESINETILEIQEMFSQDQMKSSIKAPQKELQSW